MASSGTEPFLSRSHVDLVDAAQARGFPINVSIWTIRPAIAARYADRNDGGDSLVADCRRDVVGDDGRSERSADLPRASLRCGAAALVLFDEGAMAFPTWGEVVMAPTGLGSAMWTQLSAAISAQVGDELTLALVAGHEMAHIAWDNHVSSLASTAELCSTACGPDASGYADLVETYCDVMAIWLVSTRFAVAPDTLLKALVAGRDTLIGRDLHVNWGLFARRLRQVRTEGLAGLSFERASQHAVQEALRLSGLGEHGR